MISGRYPGLTAATHLIAKTTLVQSYAVSNDPVGTPTCQLILSANAQSEFCKSCANYNVVDQDRYLAGSLGLSKAIMGGFCAFVVRVIFLVFQLCAIRVRESGVQWLRRVH